jgi:hypothetical protein
VSSTKQKFCVSDKVEKDDNASAAEIKNITVKAQTGNL